jgi:signal transduction histidine kinase
MANKVTFTLQEDSLEGMICFSFMDNGKGFETDKEMKGNGLKNIKRRAERIGATVIIQNQLTNGICIKIYIQLSNYTN